MTVNTPTKLFDIAGRLFDATFYRSLYNESTLLSDDTLIMAAHEGKIPSDRFLNPAEFLSHALSHKLLPTGFDPVGYRLSNPDLSALDADWRVALHYLQFGRTQGRGWTRPFEAEFYRDVYFQGECASNYESLIGHWRAHPSNYGTLKEAILRNGFQSDEWTNHFDVKSYLTFNTLTERVRTTAGGLLHFVEHGWRAMLPISETAQFDVGFYNDIAGGVIELAPQELYRRWIEIALPKGVAPNEGQHLQNLGLELAQYPSEFNWALYLTERPDVPLSERNRWGALLHLADHGAVEGRPLPIAPDGHSTILLAIANRAVLAGRHEAADRIFDRMLVQTQLPTNAIQHAADHANRRHRYGEALSLYRRILARDEGVPFWTVANGARCALELGDYVAAERLILAGLSAYPRSEKLRRTFYELQERRCQLAIARHIHCLRSGERDTGLEARLDEVFENFLASLRSEFGEPRKRPTRSGTAPIRVAFLANRDLPQCTFYRVSQKAEQLRDHNVELTIVDRDAPDDFLSALATADLALFYRVASDPNVLRCLATCRFLSVPVLYDIDDLVFDEKHFPDSIRVGTAAPSAWKTT